MSNFYNVLGLVTILVLLISAIYSAALDLGLADDVLKSNGWGPILTKEYFKELFFSPLWLLAAFFFSKANSHDYSSWKKQKHRIEGYLYKKDTVQTRDILKFLVNEYSIQDEYSSVADDRNRMINEAAALSADELKIE